MTERESSAGSWQLGDHLYYYRAGRVYSHHGIYCGDGMVVHYESSAWHKVAGSVGALPPPRITRVALDEFALGAPIFVRRYGQSDPAAVTVDRALSRLGESEYHLWDNNCEHFAVWCKTGQSLSTQVQAHREARRAAAQAIPVGLAVLRTARRLPPPFRPWGVAAALVCTGGAYTSHYLLARWRDRHQGHS